MNPFGLNDFQWQMLNLDCALTGKSPAEVAQQMHHRYASALLWLESGQREWYLSDGGYSRVFYDWDGNLGLDSVSTDKAKGNWPSVAELRADIEVLLKAELANAAQ